MSSYDEGKQASPITISRVINLFLMFLFAAVVVLHVVCLAVMAAKHNEIVDKLSIEDEDYNDNIKGSCILFVDYDGKYIKWVNNKCHLVIYGSGALGGCALLMIVFLILRTILFRKINFLVLLDTIEVVLTGLFAGVLAVIITLGKNETCKSIEGRRNDVSCEDVYIVRYDDPKGERVKVYAALRTAQVTSWLAVGMIGLIAVITMMRLLLWIVGINRRRCHGSTDLNPPLVEHDQLESNRYLKNVLNDDDVKSLQP